MHALAGTWQMQQQLAAKSRRLLSDISSGCRASVGLYTVDFITDHLNWLCTACAMLILQRVALQGALPGKGLLNSCSNSYANNIHQTSTMCAICSIQHSVLQHSRCATVGHEFAKLHDDLSSPGLSQVLAPQPAHVSLGNSHPPRFNSSRSCGVDDWRWLRSSV